MISGPEWAGCVCRLFPNSGCVMDSKDLPCKLKEYFLNTRMFLKFGESNLSTANAEQVENLPLFFLYEKYL